MRFRTCWVFYSQFGRFRMWRILLQRLYSQHSFVDSNSKHGQVWTAQSSNTRTSACTFKFFPINSLNCIWFAVYWVILWDPAFSDKSIPIMRHHRRCWLLKVFSRISVESNSIVLSEWSLLANSAALWCIEPEIWPFLIKWLFRSWLLIWNKPLLQRYRWPWWHSIFLLLSVFMSWACPDLWWEFQKRSNTNFGTSGWLGNRKLLRILQTQTR